MDDDAREMAMINYPISIYYAAVDRCIPAFLAEPVDEVKWNMCDRINFQLCEKDIRNNYNGKSRLNYLMEYHKLL